MEALKDKLHGTTSTFTSVKDEAGKKVEILGEDAKDLLHAGNKEIKGMVGSVKKGSASTSREVEQAKNKFCDFFANICEKICAPFSKKNN